MKRMFWVLLMLTGCAGVQRDCRGCSSEVGGANWLVVQYTMSGSVLHCWKLDNVAMENEPHSDGIYWEESGGNVVHISNLYNAVQLNGSNWDAAEQRLNLTAKDCQ